jgi:hypothetical protein
MILNSAEGVEKFFSLKVKDFTSLSPLKNSFHFNHHLVYLKKQ